MTAAWAILPRPHPEVLAEGEPRRTRPADAAPDRRCVLRGSSLRSSHLSMRTFLERAVPVHDSSAGGLLPGGFGHNGPAPEPGGNLRLSFRQRQSGSGKRWPRNGLGVPVSISFAYIGAMKANARKTESPARKRPMSDGDLFGAGEPRARKAAAPLPAPKRGAAAAVRARPRNAGRGRLRRLLDRGAGGARAGPPPARHVYRRHRREGAAPPLRRGDRQRHGRGGRRPRDLHRGRASRRAAISP